MEINITSTARLHNGIEMPWFGLGVFQMRDGKQVQDAIQYAIDLGYRSIDTAAIYRNEMGVGDALHKISVNRSEIFLTSKVWNAEQGYDSTLKAFDASLKRLKTDYLDLYLVHWPVKGKFLETYNALENIYHSGRAKAIGVSNFMIPHLKELLDHCQIIPMVNQIEFHPHLQQPELVNFCQSNDIFIEAWSPIMKGRIDSLSELENMSKKYNKSYAQITLRWEIQRGVIVIPKSVNPSRIKENANIFDFELTRKEMEFINSLDINSRYGPDPNNFDF